VKFRQQFSISGTRLPAESFSWIGQWSTAGHGWSRQMFAHGLARSLRIAVPDCFVDRPVV
jgi:hypothetical protein